MATVAQALNNDMPTEALTYEERLKFDFMNKNRLNSSQNVTASGIMMQEIVVAGQS
eukprot:CAMPEP_0185586974 /NCGR_PEP_ID=MMETSP0434-20130131/46958_1 /TAXON_ID=626734 ORGANISM="Favella taraikaensis, Strain Fe Narragansett Bay" /NCGR_SAMPLE_ID=MMETSP0434 /ASSEMBLY_ACC=CAM_ASM_000379 /LENGTH=55 /DNA_ID=CAMNT_0028208497 /DNA_START=527 /DNA_END=694 /DNA_ORIENTATION=-